MRSVIATAAIAAIAALWVFGGPVITFKLGYRANRLAYSPRGIGLDGYPGRFVGKRTGVMVGGPTLVVGVGGDTA